MTEDLDWQRLDKWLWCARFMRARGDCAALVAQSGLRINRQPTDKPHARLRVGDVVTMPLRGDVRVIEVVALAARRGPAAEARTLYREIAGVHVAVQADPCGNADSPAYPAPDPNRQASRSPR
jgi:ribosome-associated heat shock protein Hsp15